MIDKIQTLGLAAKGALYTMVGALTAMAAFDMGGSTTGRSGVIGFLQQQSYGILLMGVVAVGLLGYGLFMMYVSKDSRVYS